MGNEQSAAKVHKNLTPDIAQQIRASFPSQPQQKLWSSWSILPDECRVQLEKKLRDNNGQISWESYQNVAGSALYGSTEERIRFILELGDEPPQDMSAISVESLQKGLGCVFQAYSNIHEDNSSDVGKDSENLAASVTHELVYPGVKRKQLPKPGKDNASAVTHVDLADIEKLFFALPYLEQVLVHVLNTCYGLPAKNHLPVGIGTKQLRSRSMLRPVHTLMLHHALPHDLQEVRNWRPIFNTAVDGESFAKLAGAIKKRGPSMVIVRDEKDNIFGGFAAEEWRPGPKFYGESSSFLFHLHPVINIYDTTPFNQNYQYFNLKQKTLPNGLGMGGQLDYFGFWIDSEFGLVKTAPSCTTFHSPQLGVLEGKIRDLEVWGVGPEPGLDEEGGRSVLDMDPEAQMVMEMMGKTFHSKMLRDPEQDDDET